MLKVLTMATLMMSFTNVAWGAVEDHCPKIDCADYLRVQASQCLYRKITGEACIPQAVPRECQMSS